jgi:hypothetical protein
MRRLAYAFLVVLALAVVARPLLRGQLFTFRDHTDYFQPLRWFTATTLQAGHLPLWNPYNASGEPWLANPQTAVFYPPAWLFLVLPFAAAYMLYLALHLALLGCGAFLLFSQRASLGAALIGAVALTFCGPTLSLLDVQNNLTTFAWLPLVIWCGTARASPMGSAAAIAMSFLAGEPFFAAVGALIFVVVRRRDVLDVAAQSFALAAVQLVPFLAMLHGSDRVSSAMSSEEILRQSMPLRDWLRVAVPPSLTASGYDAHLGQHFVPVVYVGLITCVLAAVGIVVDLTRRQRRLGRRTPPWLLLLAFAVVVSAGSHIPPVGALLAHLPLTLFRYPARLVPLGALAIAAIAVEGWDFVARFLTIRWIAVLIAVALFVELTAVARPLLVAAPMERRNQVPYATAIGRDAKIVRNGDVDASNRRAWISGYLNLYERRFDAWTAAPVVSRRYVELYTRGMNGRSMTLLGSMSIAYVLSARPLPLPLLARAPGVDVYRNPAALPLAYARDETSGRIVAPALLAFGASFVHATIDVPAPSMMIVTQQRAAGWFVEVDGRRAAPDESNLFLAVRLPAGRHEVRWSYRSMPLLAGALLTLLAIVRMLLPKSFVKR